MSFWDVTKPSVCLWNVTSPFGSLQWATRECRLSNRAVIMGLYKAVSWIFLFVRPEFHTVLPPHRWQAIDFSNNYCSITLTACLNAEIVLLCRPFGPWLLPCLWLVFFLTLALFLCQGAILVIFRFIGTKSRTVWCLVSKAFLQRG